MAVVLMAVVLMAVVLMAVVLMAVVLMTVVLKQKSRQMDSPLSDFDAAFARRVRDGTRKYAPASSTGEAASGKA
jgi:hypothetical protein